MSRKKGKNKKRTPTQNCQNEPKSTLSCSSSSGSVKEGSAHVECPPVQSRIYENSTLERKVDDPKDVVKKEIVSILQPQNKETGMQKDGIPKPQVVEKIQCEPKEKPIEKIHTESKEKPIVEKIHTESKEKPVVEKIHNEPKEKPVIGKIHNGSKEQSVWRIHTEPKVKSVAEKIQNGPKEKPVVPKLVEAQIEAKVESKVKDTKDPHHVNQSKNEPERINNLPEKSAEIDETPKKDEETIPMGKVIPDCLQLEPFSIKLLENGTNLVSWYDYENNKKWNPWAYPFSCSRVNMARRFSSYEIKRKAELEEDNSVFHFISETKTIKKIIKMANGCESPVNLLMLKEGNSIMIDELYLEDIYNGIPSDPILFKFLKKAFEKDVNVNDFTYSQDWVEVPHEERTYDVPPVEACKIVARSMKKNLPGFRDATKEPVDAISKTAEFYLIKDHSSLFLYDVNWNLGNYSMYLGSRTPICSLDTDKRHTIKFTTSLGRALKKDEAIDMFIDNCLHNVKTTLLYHHTEYIIEESEVIGSMDILKRASLIHEEIFKNGETIFEEIEKTLKPGILYYMQKKAGSEEKFKIINLNENWNEESKELIEKSGFPGKIIFEDIKEEVVEEVVEEVEEVVEEAVKEDGKERGDGNSFECESKIVPKPPRSYSEILSTNPESKVIAPPHEGTPRGWLNGLSTSLNTVGQLPSKNPFSELNSSAICASVRDKAKY